MIAQIMEKQCRLSIVTIAVLCLARMLVIEGFFQHCFISSLSTTSSHHDTIARLLRIEASINGDTPGRRIRQVRKKSVNRHPPGYWQNMTNVKKELLQFWIDLGVMSLENNSHDPPIIPSEGLLNYFQRHDLRYVVVLYGGRESLSHRLGGARIMPGKWSEAVQANLGLQELLRNASYAGLSPDLPPLLPQQRKDEAAMNSSSLRNQTRWSHREGRKPKGYWTMEVVVQELYHYLDQHQERTNRPSVWMPRLGEFTKAGRDDLRQAIVRFGGCANICRLAGLIPYREWHYFEGQYELLVNLRDYLDTYHNGSRSEFPLASTMKRHGYDQLYSLTQFYGGRKFLANRFSMTYTNNPRHHVDDMNWGPFNIDTAIALLRFVRADQMRKKGPLKRPAIVMPSERKLLANGAERLHRDIMELGGYEGVARRLGLEFFV